jgi:hypothetical protein
MGSETPLGVRQYYKTSGVGHKHCFRLNGFRLNLG